MDQKPWSEVIDWFVDQSSLAYICAAPSDGEVQIHQSQKAPTHSLADVIDIINEGLAKHKCILIRRDASFIISAALRSTTLAFRDA